MSRTVLGGTVNVFCILYRSNNFCGKGEEHIYDKVFYEHSLYLTLRDNG